MSLFQEEHASCSQARSAEASARQAEQRAHASDPVAIAMSTVEMALLMGLSVACPACGEGTEKDNACMHMTCRCGACYCYACGGGLHECRRGAGCDEQSCFLEQNPGWQQFGDGRGALVEFHRRRSSAFVQLARHTTLEPVYPGIWEKLQATHPTLLSEIMLFGTAVLLLALKNNRHVGIICAN